MRSYFYAISEGGERLKQELYLVEKLFENKKKELMRSPEAWLEYLETAGKHYKYDFADAALIDAQNKDATALATAEFWESGRMNRKLKKDAVGVAVIRSDGKRVKFEYLIDASQTIGPEDHRLAPWTYQSEYDEEILQSLPYPLLQNDSEHDTLEAVISQQVFDEALALYREAKPESEKDQSDLIFAQVASSSAVYCIGKRCGWEFQYDHQTVMGLMRHLDEADFQMLNGLLDKTRRDVLTAIGDIARKQERERRENHEDRIRKTERDIVPASGNERTAGQGFEPLRDDGERVHAGEAPRPLSGTQDERPDAGVLSPGGGRSQGQDREPIRAVAEAGKEPGGAGGDQQSAGAGSLPEQSETPGGGNGHRDVYLPTEVVQNQEKEPEKKQERQGTKENQSSVPFLLPEYAIGDEVDMDGERYIIVNLSENDITLSQPDMPIFNRIMARSDFDAAEKTFIQQPHDYLKDALMLTNLKQGFEQIHMEYQQGTRGKAFADYLKETGYRGDSFTFDTLESGMVDVTTRGLEIGVYADEGHRKDIYSWRQVAKAVGEMIEAGVYPADKEARDEIWRERHDRYEHEIIGLPSDEALEADIEARLIWDVQMANTADVGERFRELAQERWERWQDGYRNHIIRQWGEVYHDRYQVARNPDRLAERKAKVSPEMLRVIESLKIGDEVFFAYLGDSTQIQMIYDLDFEHYRYQYIDDTGRFNIGHFSALAHHLEQNKENLHFFGSNVSAEMVVADSRELAEMPDREIEIYDHNREISVLKESPVEAEAALADESEDENEEAERTPLEPMAPGKVTQVLRDVVAQGTGDWLVDTVVIALYLAGRLENVAENAVRNAINHVMDKKEAVLPELEVTPTLEGLTFESDQGIEFAPWSDVADAVLLLEEQKVLALPESILTREASMNSEAVIYAEPEPEPMPSLFRLPTLTESETERYRWRGSFDVIAGERITLDGNREFIMPFEGWRDDNLSLTDVTPGMVYPISQSINWSRFIREFEANPANRKYDAVLQQRQTEIDVALAAEEALDEAQPQQTENDERNQDHFLTSQGHENTLPFESPEEIAGADMQKMMESILNYIDPEINEYREAVLREEVEIRETPDNIFDVAGPGNVLPFQSRAELEEAEGEKLIDDFLDTMVVPQIEALREEWRRDEIRETAQRSIVDRDGNIISVDLMDDQAKQFAKNAEHYYFPENHALAEGGVKTKYKRNVAAIRLLKEIEDREKNAEESGLKAPPVTKEEQEVLSLYAGWGGLPQVFEPNKPGWENEYRELAELLSEKEYRSAFQSVWNAFYTPPEIIGEIYRGLENMGFEGGRILDPCMGTGHFFGAMPESLRNCYLTGIELDEIPGRIAQRLYPNADIKAKGYQDVYIPNHYFDVAVGNVPFGQVKVHDTDYDDQGLSIHDYFFAKTLDKVREGGVVAFITSTSTLDQKDGHFRRYMAERANLLGAVRLPSKTFSKVAHTEASADIIFLQKRGRVRESMPEWVDIAQTEDGVPVNGYFAENPHMMLGELKFDPKFFGNENSTLLHAHEGQDLQALLHEAIGQIKGEIKPKQENDFVLDEDGKAPERWYAAPDMKNNSYVLVQDKQKNEHIYYRNGPDLERVDVRSPKRLRAMMDVRDAARRVIQMQLPSGRSGIGAIDEGMFQKALRDLNRVYDDFVKQHGHLNDKYNVNLFREDIDAPFLLSLENIDAKGNTHKADIFSKRTVFPQKEITSVETAQEALSVSLSRKGFIDLPYMAELTSKTEKDVASELEGQIFLNPNELAPPEKRWLTSADYLSGNVRVKLEQAEQLAAQDERFLPNVKALQEVQPAPIPAEDIQISLGANWVPEKDIRAFTKYLFPSSNLSVDYSDITGQWKLDGSKHWSFESHQSYGTERADGYKLLEMTLNQKSARFYDEIIVRDDNGKEHKKRKLNGPDSAVAIRMQMSIRQKFEEWLRQDPQRMERLANIYNERFNSERLCHYDGQFLDFPGMNPSVTLREHQKDAVARCVYGGNTLLAHEVGTGKTYTMIAAAMKKKQLGLANKQVIAVPKHLVRQFGKDFMTLYPQANILVASERDFEAGNRRRFLSKLATNEFDAIIMSHEQFGRIALSPEKQNELLEQQAEEIRAGLMAVTDNQSFNAKRMAKLLDNIEAKQGKLLSVIDDKKDRMLTMEEMGIDGVFVDEAHAFKNLPFTTNLENVSGLSNGVSQRAIDMRTKVQYLNELTGNQNVVFSTGTPVSNTIAEAYLMQMYLQPEYLKEKGLRHFDSWVANFAEPSTQMELKPAGDGYRPRTRFMYFNNLPELLHQFHRVADVKFANDLPDVERPDIAGGKMQTVVAEPSEFQEAYIKSLGDRADNISGGLVDANQDNMLLICTDGRKAALDMRLIDPTYPDHPGSKINLAADRIAAIYQETNDKRSTQLVFSDMGTPNTDGRYSVYDSLKEKLVERGIPENEIAFIHDAAKNEEKEVLFSRMRSGDLRVLVGSTQKCGAGTNVQDKMIALHQLDCPWKPSDVEQRVGRGHRQGNENPEIRLYNYVTRNSFDSYNWQIIEQKQRIVGQIMRGDVNSRRVKDVDDTVQNYAEIKAIASGNPLIREKVTLENQIGELKNLQSAYVRKQSHLQESVNKTIPERQTVLRQTLDHYTKDRQVAEANYNADSPVQLGDKIYESKTKAGEALLDGLRKLPIGQNDFSKISDYCGFELKGMRELDGTARLYLQGSTRYPIEVSAAPLSLMNHVEQCVKQFGDRILRTETELQDLSKRYQDSLVELEKPFEQQEELNTALAQFSVINDELNLKDNDVEIGSVMDDDEILSADSSREQDTEYEMEP